MTSVRTTSKLSYDNLKRSGRFDEIKADVVRVFEGNGNDPLNRRQIGILIGVEPSTLTAPVKELVEENVLRRAFFARDPHTDQRVEYLELSLGRPPRPEPIQAEFGL